MSEIKYLKISNNIKIRYLTNNLKKNPYVVFLHGFMSDIDGEKPKLFSKFCKRHKIGFYAFEYSGHGKSSGKFTKGNISLWSNQVKFAIKKKIKKKKIYLNWFKHGSLAVNFTVQKFWQANYGFYWNRICTRILGESYVEKIY